MKKIAIDKNLTGLEDYLQDKGYEIQEFDSNDTTTPSYNTKNFTYYKFEDFDAVITEDANRNSMGIPNILTSTPVINAKGLTPEEVEGLIIKKTTSI